MSTSIAQHHTGMVAVGCDRRENSGRWLVGGVLAARRPRATRERPTVPPRDKSLWGSFPNRAIFRNSSPVARELRRGWLQFTCKPEPMAFALDLTMVKLVC